MVVISLAHSTHKRNAGAIGRWGLRARKPSEHNYKGWSMLCDQPKGVYCTWHDDENVPWPSGGSRVYRIAWSGPIMPDPYLDSPSSDLWAVVVPMNVPPTCLSVLS